MSQWLPLEVTQSLIIPIELSLNHALQYAPATLAALRPYQGQLLALHIEPLGSFFIRFLDEGLQFSQHNEAQADASLSGSWVEFAQLARAKNKAGYLINSNIDMTGDSDLPIKIAGIMESLDIDWEALIAPVTGGLLAHQIGKGFRRLWQFGQRSQEHLTAMGKDYIEDERQWLANATEVEQLAERIDALKLGSDRLQARIEHLFALHSKE